MGHVPSASSPGGDHSAEDRPAPPGRSLLPVPPSSASRCACFLWPMSVLRGHTDKIRAREENRGAGRRWGGLAEPRAWTQRRGACGGAWETAVLRLLHVLRWCLSVSDLKPNTSFSRVNVCSSLLKIRSPCYLRGQGHPAPRVGAGRQPGAPSIRHPPAPTLDPRLVEFRGISFFAVGPEVSER